MGAVESKSALMIQPISVESSRNRTEAARSTATVIIQVVTVTVVFN